MIKGQISHPYFCIEEVAHHTLVEIHMLMNIGLFNNLSLFPAEF